MITQINGLHHVTSLASSASQNNTFFTKVLGLRRVKKTVNFDAPDVYHLYYGDELGSAGSVMTYFPFPHAKRGTAGAGEVSTTAFSVPEGALSFWEDRFATLNIEGLERETSFGQNRLSFLGPDGDEFALVENDDPRRPWHVDGIPHDVAIRGFHSAEMRLTSVGADSSAELLKFMGYEALDQSDGVTRFHVPNGNESNVIDIVEVPSTPANQGAGRVHHIAFSVDTREDQLAVRKALLDTGYQVTPVIDRDYFWAIYFRSPGGVLFEIATNEPGFDRDEDTAHLGQALKLPTQHEHLRDHLEIALEPIGD